MSKHKKQCKERRTHFTQHIKKKMPIADSTDDATCVAHLS
ncbi:hypothetical protein SAMN04488055_4712 [Chitinophaga niabensis]|uniref:Uncharacterized protein n=1 Tax=Chitinophaga niabensis TaxID=536979 RepID=A0A1N6JYX3_9BACT|nr:hypothetical protein SAMN04488055_4712 [Chitinophaga niabensis]